VAETRKLAAILAADVVGFSRLAGFDEERTLARLRALRSDLIDPTIAVYNGRVVKRTGWRLEKLLSHVDCGAHRGAPPNLQRFSSHRHWLTAATALDR
jgi:class 3 adenylate cyclase